MIRKHWMLRDYPVDSIDMSKMSDEVDRYGYESMLVTVYPMEYDMWTMVLNSIKDEHSFKYMMAVRPYLFSPQYLAMLITSFNKISPERLMINLVHGSIRSAEDFNGILGYDKLLKDPGQRRSYLVDFVLKLFNDVRMSVDFQIPEVVISGQSPEALEAANIASKSIALWHDMFTGSTDYIMKNKFDKVYVSTYILATETDEEAINIIKGLKPERQAAISLYGSKEKIKSQIKNLENLGVTDILFSQYGPNFSRQPIHELLLELSQEGILS
jgi:alkanesulfonate monooxygenase SsuD/methylene tetrahydromethanopterin reductase-like flavin-dependent oxidoreductase (luciferase family)